MNPQLRLQVEHLVGSRVVGDRTLTGGDINQAHGLTLADGREVFAKGNLRAHQGMFAAEARGLAWLAEAGAIRVPSTIAVSDTVLVLEWVKPGRPASSFDERLGQQLAALHLAGVGTETSTGTGTGTGTGTRSFGLGYDNFIGTLPQDNTPAEVWAEFYRERRIAPQVRLATDNGFLPPKLKRTFARVLPRLDEWTGPAEPVARLHGDLWSGNLLCDSEGAPCLIDPSVYGGHREVDLAMMRLFGGFSARVFAAYEEIFPLATGHEDRTPLYQLYPLLVHLNLFGGAYLGSVEAALGKLS